MAQSLNCPKCGAAVQIDSQFIRTITCGYCSSVLLLRGSDGLDFSGQTTSLADYPSRLSIGARGTIRGREFTVLGRARYSYDQGFWEEWQIAWADGQAPAWLEEDEGLWTVFTRQKLRQAIPAYAEVRVGSSLRINGQSVFVTEKRQGRLAGSAGQFSSVLPVAEPFGYFQGAADNATISVNYWPDEIEMSIGDELESQDLVVL